MERSMQLGNFRAELNLPRGLVSRFDGAGNEISQSLPPYAHASVMRVEDLAEVPGDWIRSDRDTAVYVASVNAGDGMWLNFHGEQDFHTAVLVDVQGVNALTALPVPKMRNVPLEQYRHNCPVHHTPFGRDRLDGFRVSGANGEPRGQVRQFLFADAEQGTGVAQNLIGPDRSFCIKLHVYRGPRKQAPSYRFVVGPAMVPSAVFRSAIRAAVTRPTKQSQSA
jgi:hypothetical protein